jgi:hypothetical protein
MMVGKEHSGISTLKEITKSYKYTLSIENSLLTAQTKLE